MIGSVDGSKLIEEDDNKLKNDIDFEKLLNIPDPT